MTVLNIQHVTPAVRQRRLLPRMGGPANGLQTIGGPIAMAPGAARWDLIGWNGSVDVHWTTSRPTEIPAGISNVRAIGVRPG